MFIHASITHIVFNLAALAYIGGYIREVNWNRQISCNLFSIWHMRCFVPWGNSLLCLRQRSDIVDRGIRCYLGSLGYCSCNWEPKSYYWLIIQIVFAFVGSVTSIPIAFTAHVGGFLAGVILTKLMSNENCSIEGNQAEWMKAGHTRMYLFVPV